MSKYTAEQVRDSLQKMHGHPLTVAERAELFLMASSYAALLRERESAKAAVTDEMVEYASRIYTDASPLAVEAMRAVLEAVAQMLASARVPDVDLVERCKEVLAWKSTGLLRGDYLREYAKAAPNHDDDLQWAEEQTKTQAMRVLAAAPKSETEEN